jgi:hypothetical protein
MESTYTPRQSMLTLILHCNRTKAPKGFFSFMALLKKEIKAFNIAKADTRDTFIARMKEKFPYSVPNFVDIPLTFPATSFPTL